MYTKYILGDFAARKTGLAFHTGIQIIDFLSIVTILTSNTKDIIYINICLLVFILDITNWKDTAKHLYVITGQGRSFFRARREWGGGWNEAPHPIPCLPSLQGYLWMFRLPY